MLVYVENSGPMARSPLIHDSDSLEAMGERLAMLRKALDYSQEFIAKLAGVGQTAWVHYEKGRRRPEFDVVIKLEAATGAPMEWVYRGIMARMPYDLIQKIELARREVERERRKRR